MTETLFLAAPSKRVLTRYPAYERFYTQFAPVAARFCHVQTLDLPDIWVRDFLPEQNPITGELCQFYFAPRYANYTPHFTEQIRRAAVGCFPSARAVPVRLDGGNILRGPDGTVFCLARSSIFCKSNPAEQARVEAEILRALSARQAVWLDKETGDDIGHIDGFMQFLGDTLLVSDERALLYLYALTERRLLRVRQACPQLKIRFLPCGADLHDFSLSAMGVYVNFLEMQKVVFVPQYNLPQDARALAIIKENTPKTVVPVDCTAVAGYGGAVHCLTKIYEV